MNTSLYYFIVTSEELNISKAAGRLFISQQALSKQIMKLEKEYGVILFERKPKFRLTIAGECFLRYAREVLEAEKSMMLTLDTPGVRNTVKLPIGISSAKGHVLMPLIIPEYHKHCPNVIPSVFEGTGNYLDMMLQHNRIDMYFRMKGDDIFFGEFRPLQKDELYFVVSRTMLQAQFGENWKDFLIRHVGGVAAEDIHNFPLIFPNEGSSLYTTLNKYMEQFSTKIIAEQNNYVSVVKSVLHGSCGGFLSKMFFCDVMENWNISTADIFAFPVLDIQGISTFGVVTDPNIEKTFAKEFIEIAQAMTLTLDEKFDTHLKRQHEFICSLQ